MTLGAFQQDIERICSLKQTVVQCTIQSESQLPYNTTNPEGEEEAHYYSLITLTVQKRQFTVLCANFSSPLLTCDTFLVEKSKVCFKFNSYVSFLSVRQFKNLIFLSQYDSSLNASWLVVNAQVRRLFATTDPNVAEWQEGR